MRNSYLYFSAVCYYHYTLEYSRYEKVSDLNCSFSIKRIFTMKIKILNDYKTRL